MAGRLSWVASVYWGYDNRLVRWWKGFGDDNEGCSEDIIVEWRCSVKGGGVVVEGKS